jgi:SAM-dependent methyltransferase
MRGSNRQDISNWVRRHAGRIPPASNVLDLACGNGRHARYLAGLGHRVTAIDIDLSAVIDLAADDRLELVERDLENAPWPFAGRRFGGIVVTNYLYRPLYPYLVAALSDGGTLIYDTFAAGNERFGHPRNPAFLLNPGELLNAFAEDLHIVAYDHGRVDEPRQAMRQRLCAISGLRR